MSPRSGHPASAPSFRSVCSALATTAGLFAVQLDGRARWLVPLSFVSVMIAGAALGMAGIEVPFVEVGIALSVVVLGLAVALRLHIPTAAAMGLVALFSIFHGHAHGAEMPESALGLAYGAGIVLATALLHALGIALGLGIGKARTAVGQRTAQTAGSAMALAGIAILIGYW